MCSSLSWLMNKSKFAKRFTRVLYEIDENELSTHNKLMLKERFIPMVNSMIIESIHSNIFYLTLQSTITIGSILVPALLSTEQISIDNNTTMEDKVRYEYNLYWSIWGISLSVTLSNAIIQLSNMDKKYVMRHIHVSQMKKEGWSFLQKSGDVYGKYKNVLHNQFIHVFWERIEKFRLNCVTSDLSYDRIDNENDLPRITADNNPSRFTRV